MKNDYHQLLKPEIIKTVSGLALIARIIADGYLSGYSHSKRVGSGMEFSQFRTYEPGDDLRLLDWKMLARSNRYYIKQAEIETNITVKFVLDASRSMLHTEKGLSKMDYGRVLIATLTYIAHNQGDAVGLFALNQQQLYSVYPKVQKQHFNRLLQELLLVKNQGKWPENARGIQQLQHRGGKELLFFVTDLYEHGQELSSFVKRLKTPKNEVVVMHLLGKNELEFNYKGMVTFEDLETGTKLKVDAQSAQKEYLNAMQQFTKKIKEDLLTHAIDYHQFVLGTPIEEAIQLFLKRRNRLR
ncbi:DUF58 domain-containing protein [Spongiimicrobium salis]|uniref:DUF58 domain-containing protein n=1 Tax=Spongiimicrobium salis TaxID=1667022 RepID=UPI00374D37BC